MSERIELNLNWPSADNPLPSGLKAHAVPVPILAKARARLLFLVRTLPLGAIQERLLAAGFPPATAPRVLSGEVWNIPLAVNCAWAFGIDHLWLLMGTGEPKRDWGNQSLPFSEALPFNPTAPVA